MIKHFFLISLRSLLKNRFFTFINIAGLSIGLAASILITLFVIYELGYDRYNEKSERIYRIGLHGRMGGTEFTQTYTTPMLASELVANCPEIETAVRLYPRTAFVKSEEGSDVKIFEESSVFTSDSSIFQIFTLPIIAGQHKDLLTKPTDLVINESIARKYFGQEIPLENIIGKTLLIRTGGEFSPLSITAIMKDMPDQSHFHIDILGSNMVLSFNNENSWWNNYFKTYFLLAEGKNIEDVREKLPYIYRKNMGEDRFDTFISEGNAWESFIQPLNSIHLQSHVEGELEVNGNIQYVIIFAISAVFLLIIACINFVNLSTAKGAIRAREVGIKKTIGAARRSLVLQFLIESTILSLFSIVLALILAEVSLPYLKRLSGINIDFNHFEILYTIPLVLLFGGILGILAGLYPALYLTSYKPINAIQKGSYSGPGNRSFRNFLVVFQFCISIVMISCTFFISRQLEFIQSKNLGFNKENIVVLKNAYSIDGKEESLKQKLKELPGVKVVSASYSVPGQGYGNIQFRPEGYDQNILMDVIFADWDYDDVFKIGIKQGRFLDRDFPSDSLGFILNAAAAKHLGWEDPIGKELRFGGQRGLPGHIIGVIDDYHYVSMHSEVRPMVILPAFNRRAWSNNFVSIRMEGNETMRTIKDIEKVWAGFSDLPFDYFFMDESYDGLYRNEMRTKTVFQVFSFLTIFIAVLGLLGLITFSTEQRSKEIGIRKSMGASVNQIVIMLSRDFTRWIVVGFIIACPLAYMVINAWLKNFAYRIDVSFIWFVVSGLLVIVIAWLAVSYQSIRSAMKNPVDVLRNE